MNHAATASQTSSRSAVLTEAVAETAKRLDIKAAELAQIIGVSPSSASRLLNAEFMVKEGTPEWQLSALFVRLYRGLYSIVGNSDALARDWLASRNLAFDNRLPIEEIKTILGLVYVCDYIDAHRAPA